MPITSGVYILTNVRQGNPVSLSDGNDLTPIMGHYRQDVDNERWEVIDRRNGRYSIRNVDHQRYANCGIHAGPKTAVEGHDNEQLWEIRQKFKGEYTIATSSGLLWMLPDMEQGTPVELFDVPTDPRCLWTFTDVVTGTQVNDGGTLLVKLFELGQLPIVPFSPLRLDFVVIQESSEDSIPKAAATIDKVCGPLVSRGSQPEDLRVNIIRFKSVGSDVSFNRSNFVTCEKLCNDRPSYIPSEAGSLSSWQEKGIGGLRVGATKVAILNLGVIPVAEGATAIIELVKLLIKQDITLVLAPIQPTWANAFGTSEIHRELKKLSSGSERSLQDAGFSEYVIDYDKRVALPRIAKDEKLLAIPAIIEMLKGNSSDAEYAASTLINLAENSAKLRGAIRPNIPLIIEIFKDKNHQGAQSAASSALSAFTKHAELRDAIFEGMLGIIETPDGTSDGAGHASSTDIKRVEAEHRNTIRLTIPYIIDMLKDKDPGRQLAAASALSKAIEYPELREAIRPTIPLIIEMLKDKNPVTQSAAAQALSKFTEYPELRDTVRPNIAKIIDMFKDKNPVTQSDAAKALSKFTKYAELRDEIRASVPHIITMLKDENPDARSAAAYALSEFTKSPELRAAIAENIHRVIEMFKDENRDAQSAAAEALSQFTKYAELREAACQTIPQIIAMLKDKNHDARSAAAEALSRFTKFAELREAILWNIASIIKMLEDKNHDEQSVAAAAKALSDFTAYPEIRVAIHPSIPLVINMLNHRSGDAQSAAAEALSMFTKYVELRETIQPQIPTVIEMLKDESYDAQSAATTALSGFIAHAELRGAIHPSIPLIVNRLNDKNPVTQSDAAEALSKFIKYADLRATLRQHVPQIIMMVKDENRGVESAAALALSKFAERAELHDAIFDAVVELIKVPKRNRRAARELAAETLEKLTKHGELRKVLVTYKDKSGRTLLSLVAQDGNSEVTRLLLRQPSVPFNLKDNSGRSPFSWAFRNLHFGVETQLVRKKLQTPAKDV